MPGEGALERHRRIACTEEVHRGTVNDQRQGIVGRFAVILKTEGLHAGHGHAGHLGPPSFFLGNLRNAGALA
jgi:hypothetical protein